MKRELATDLMADLVALDVSMNSIVERIGQIEDPDEHNALKQAIYKVIGDVYCDLMRPIIRQYPDLDPDPDEPGPV